MKISLNIYFISLLALSVACHSQNFSRSYILAVDTSYINLQDKNVCLHKVLIKNENKISELLEIKNSYEDFAFTCQYLGNDGLRYIVFSNYGSASGITWLYYLRESDSQVFESEPIYEYEIPIIASYDIDHPFIRIISFKEGDCGYLTNKNLTILEMRDKLYSNQTEILKNCKLIVEIPIY